MTPPIKAATAGAQYSSEALPPPTPAQMSEMRKMLSDPKQFAEMMSNQSMQEVYNADPMLANAVANNPIMQSLNRRGMGSLNEEDFRKMQEMMLEMR